MFNKEYKGHKIILTVLNFYKEYIIHKNILTVLNFYN